MELISEYFVKPRYEVEGAKLPCHLGPLDVAGLSIDPIQKGLLFDDKRYSSTLSDLLEKLRESLSLALVHFYPLAGRFTTQKIEGEHASFVYIDCNKGPGARLIHATASNTSIQDILSPNYVPTVVHSLFDFGEKSVNHDGHFKPLLSIQVTQLVDGVFIAFTMNHSVVDGTSFLHFISTLSEIFSSSEGTLRASSKVQPVFNYKPWIKLGDYETSPIIKLPYLEPEEFITRYDPGPLRERIFNFSSTSIAMLKAKANQECSTHNISSFQALTALVWRSVTRARNLSLDQETSCAMVINARSRFEPPISDNHFGNFVGQAKGTCKVGELLGHNLGWAAMHVNEAIKAQDNKGACGDWKAIVDAPFVHQPGGDNIHGLNKVLIGGSARFNMYGLEFGLGKPLAVRMGYANKEDGKVTANPGCEGGGSVDLEISLKPRFMEVLEADQEFISYVSMGQ